MIRESRRRRTNMNDLFIEFDGPAVDLMATTERGLVFLREHFQSQQPVLDSTPLLIELDGPICGYPAQAEAVIDAACAAGLRVEVVRLSATTKET
jgi:hypothetical protein